MYETSAVGMRYQNTQKVFALNVGHLYAEVCLFQITVSSKRSFARFG